MAVDNVAKRIQKLMRSDPGVDGDAQRLGEMTWMFFLKVYDTQEENWELEAEMEGKKYVSIIPEPCRWRNWAVDNKDGKALTGEALLNFVSDQLFPTLKTLPVQKETPVQQAIVREVFEGLNHYMKNGIILRQVLNIVNEMDLGNATEQHMFGNIYEGLLKDLQSAGHAGEFYTPRALTDLIIELLHPQLGEVVGDFAAGTGGFLTSALNYLKPQLQNQTVQAGQIFEQSIIGQEWKPLPYLLGITNLLLHNISAPRFTHGDSLGKNVRDYREEDKVDVIAMNPPYGGSTEASVLQNFPKAFRSKETVDLFIALIMFRLKKHGRAGVVVPDGFLFETDNAAKVALKQDLLKKFNLHTILRLPSDIFQPYTPLAVNVLFFDNERAPQAQEGFCTDKVWFYRLDKPKNYKHFSKTKPLLSAHCQPVRDWWNDRKEIILEEGNEKSRCFTAQELLDRDCNFDLCKFPQSVETVLEPKELLSEYWARRHSLEHEVDKTLDEIQTLLGLSINHTKEIE